MAVGLRLCFKRNLKTKSLSFKLVKLNSILFESKKDWQQGKGGGLAEKDQLEPKKTYERHSNY